MGSNNIIVYDPVMKGPWIPDEEHQITQQQQGHLNPTFGQPPTDGPAMADDTWWSH